MAERSHFVVGTAGHVDHGKTSLVKVLTGTDCDRLPEEKARGITIDLGFAQWTLPNGLSASIVDVPGHERFVRTMTAGAAGIDLVLLVVAADDGVMPQTREHLAICALLGVTKGVVAITKADLVDAEMLALVFEDVRQAAAGTFLEGADMIAFSSKDERGKGELTAAVVRALGEVTRKAASGPAFLPIDRVFTKAGAGAVVTGTLVRGTLRVGDGLDAYPTSKGEIARVTIRGLHVHGVAVGEASAASRVAVNVRGDDDGALARGNALASPDWQLPTRAVTAELTLLKTAPSLRKRTLVMLHAGTSHRAVQLTIIGKSSLAAGETAIVRMAAEDLFPAYAGQRFVLRRPDLDEDRTIGGGCVVDPHAEGARAYAGMKDAAAEDDAHARVRMLVDGSRYEGIDSHDIARRILPGDDAGAAIDALVREGAVVRVGTRAYGAPLLDEAKAEVLAQLAAFHEARPMLDGMPSAELATRTPVRLRALVEPAIAALALAKRVARDADLIRVFAHERSAGVDEIGAKIAAHYARAGLAPPLDEEARLEAKLTPPVFRDALAALKRDGKLRLLTGGLHFDVASLTALKGDVARWFQTNRALSPNDLKALCGGLTRKHAIPLLEFLDAEGVTKRSGDSRLAGPKAVASGT